MVRQKGWSKRARQKGYGVEYSTIKYYRDRGFLIIRIPQKQQRGWFDGLDYIVVEKGKLGQSKYKKKYLDQKARKRMHDTKACYPSSSLTLELSYRDGKWQPLKLEEFE